MMLRNRAHQKPASSSWVTRAKPHESRYILHRLYNEHVVETREIEGWLLDKYKRVVDIDFVRINNSMNLQVCYRHPDNPQLYANKMVYLVQMINLWRCALHFKTLIETSDYPDFVLNPQTMDIIELPVLINIDIPMEDIDTLL